jgi:hypothetical protein
MRGCSGISEVEEKYVSVYGKACTLVRFHQCFICRWVPHHFFTFSSKIFPLSREIAHENMLNFATFSGKCRKN